jgi:hypothetical protein
MDSDENRRIVMSPPPKQVINLRKTSVPGALLRLRLGQEGHVYIGRNLQKYVHDTKPEYNKWGNPYPLSKYSREESFRKYEIYACKNLMDQLHELSGKTLICWCVPLPCHGHILIKLYKEKYCRPHIHIPHGAQ